MKSLKLPTVANGFDGAKFAARYSLAALKGDFYVEGGVLYYPDSLPDAPILEACDPPPARPDAALASIKAGTGTAGEVLAVVRYLVLTGRL